MCPLGIGRKKFPEKRTTSASHVRWVVKEKSFRFLRPNRHLVSVGYWREKSFRTFWPNTIFVKGVLEKNFQKFLAKQPISLQWILGEKSFRFFWPNGDFCPVGTEERKLQNLSFKTGKTLQWVVERRNFRKPSVLALCRGYQLRDENFLQKSLVKTTSHDRWEVRRDFFSEKADHLDGFPPVGIEDGIKPSGKDDYRYVRKAATGIKGTRCLLPLEI